MNTSEGYLADLAPAKIFIFPVADFIQIPDISVGTAFYLRAKSLAGISTPSQGKPKSYQKVPHPSHVEWQRARCHGWERPF